MKLENIKKAGGIAADNKMEGADATKWDELKENDMGDWQHEMNK